MKIATVLGTRPEIIRLSRVIEKLDALCDHTLIHTGQNYDPNLNDIFFRDLGVRQPDHYLGAQSGRFGDQVGQILSRVEEVFIANRPDRLLILGDTNSGLAAFIAKRMGIPVYHMEAGNRCFDDRVPEEVNRRVIDHSQRRAHALHRAQPRQPAPRRHRLESDLRHRQSRSSKSSSTIAIASTLPTP